MVARHRKPPLELVDERLRTYRQADWSQSGDEGWAPAWLRWIAARKAWREAHPQSQALGDRVQQMRVELSTQRDTARAQWNATHGPDDYPTAERW